MSLDFLPTTAWSSYGSLPTVFTPPAKCNYLTIATPTPSSTTSTYYNIPTYTTTAYPYLLFQDPVRDPACFPTQFTYPPAITTAPGIYNASILNPPTGLLYPGRCPQDWRIDTLSYSYLPASYTIARCCPTFQSSSESSEDDEPNNPKEKRGSGGGRKKTKPKKNGSGPNPYVNCAFSLSPLTDSSTNAALIGTSTTDTSTQYAPITAIDNSATPTTIAAQEWFSKAGGVASGRSVYATGIVVMWKSGDFPDLDASLAAKSHSASASASATAAADGWVPPPRSVFLKPGVIAGMVVGVLAFVFGIVLCCKYSRVAKRKQKYTKANSV